MQHFEVPHKVLEARGPLRRLAMKYFFLRYKTLETANFPLRTRENAVCLVLLCVSCVVRMAWLGGLAVAASLFTTLVCTAPCIGRITPVRRWDLWLVHYPMVRSMEALDWCTGTNKYGYIMHLTAPKLLGYGYLSPQRLDTVCSLAIVRNPYTRMVSIYGYNRFTEAESFSAFLRRWAKLMMHYIQRAEKEEWYTPCHCLPQFEYTHHNGTQIVHSVVKQEELKYLKTKDGAHHAIRRDSSIADLPEIVRNALLGMPHTNSRPTSQKWHDYYDQETMELTYQLYKHDFDIFGYDTAIKERPDLIPPKQDRRDAMQAMKFDRFSRNSLLDVTTGSRLSRASLFGSVKKTVRSDNVLRSSQLRQSLLSHPREDILASMIGVYDHRLLSNSLEEEGSGSEREESTVNNTDTSNDSGSSSFEWSQALIDSVDRKKDQ